MCSLYWILHIEKLCLSFSLFLCNSTAIHWWVTFPHRQLVLCVWLKGVTRLISCKQSEGVVEVGRGVEGDVQNVAETWEKERWSEKEEGGSALWMSAFFHRAEGLGNMEGPSPHAEWQRAVLGWGRGRGGVGRRDAVTGPVEWKIWRTNTQIMQTCQLPVPHPSSPLTTGTLITLFSSPLSVSLFRSTSHS